MQSLCFLSLIPLRLKNRNRAGGIRLAHKAMGSVPSPGRKKEGKGRQEKREKGAGEEQGTGSMKWAKAALGRPLSPLSLRGRGTKLLCLKPASAVT